MNRIHAMAMLSVAALAAAIAPAASSQERMRAGLWEMTTTKGGATINTGTRCMTAEETGASNGDAKVVRDMLDKSFAKSGCTLKEMTATGKSISYAADCGTGTSAYTLSSTADYRGDNAEIQMTVKHGATVDVMVTKGHRIGACP